MGSGDEAGAAVARSGLPFGSWAGHPTADYCSSPPLEPPLGFKPASGIPAELDCLRHLLPAKVLAAAAERADAIGTGADRVLIAAGRIDEETYLRALSETHGLAFEDFDGVARAQCPIDDVRLIESATTGLLPLTVADGLAFVIAPRCTAVRGLLRLIEQKPAVTKRLRLTSAGHFNRFVMRGAGEAIAERAAETLKRQWPLLSAASSNRLGSIASMTAVGTLLLTALIFAPATTVLAFEVLLAAIFLAWLALRLTGAFIDRPTDDSAPAPTDDTLPVYSIIAALYREASSVGGLLAAIERLDYPGIR